MNRRLKKTHLLRSTRLARSNVPQEYASARRVFVRLASAIFLSRLSVIIATRNAHLLRCAPPPRSNVLREYAFARRFVARLVSEAFLTGLSKMASRIKETHLLRCAPPLGNQRVRRRASNGFAARLRTNASFGASVLRRILCLPGFVS
jgi:hypothetical protein